MLAVKQPDIESSTSQSAPVNTGTERSEAIKRQNDAYWEAVLDALAISGVENRVLPVSRAPANAPLDSENTANSSVFSF